MLLSLGRLWCDSYRPPRNVGFDHSDGRVEWCKDALQTFGLGRWSSYEGPSGRLRTWACQAKSQCGSLWIGILGWLGPFQRGYVRTFGQDIGILFEPWWCGIVGACDPWYGPKWNVLWSFAKEWPGDSSFGTRAWSGRRRNGSVAVETLYGTATMRDCQTRAIVWPLGRLKTIQCRSCRGVMNELRWKCLNFL